MLRNSLNTEISSCFESISFFDNCLCHEISNKFKLSAISIQAQRGMGQGNICFCHLPSVVASAVEEPDNLVVSKASVVAVDTTFVV